MSQSQPLPPILADPSQAKYYTRATSDAYLYPDLEAALATPIKTFTIEFIRANATKPHPWFVATFEQPIAGTLGTFWKASVNMEMAEGSRRPGICLISLLGDRNTDEHVSLAGFAFTVRSTLTLGTIADVIMGQHQSSEEFEQTGDLTAFSYVQNAARRDFWKG
ncbi:hypothetical protein MAPG_00230 [Magnaporthiopsis poae ATCC 64411]|uniref:Uncharacterized protein n=1 Tax=Magnaporthiopsis poae (strain ATCC 64411 / 73-15) TaxID=644358 RepID=A0A0C4DKF9_MAGP6|nr:hypothetical protein MAPG_00230 [Magnaporthiopsis poae ATCC 64411]